MKSAPVLHTSGCEQLLHFIFVQVRKSVSHSLYYTFFFPAALACCRLLLIAPPARFVLCACEREERERVMQRHK